MCVLAIQGVSVVEKIDKVTFGLCLKRERLRLSLSQDDVAEKIDTTAANVSRWELGHTYPSYHFQRKLTDLFGKSLQELLSPLDPQPVPPLHKQDEDTSGAPQRQGDAIDQTQTGETPHAGLHFVFYFNICLPSPREFYGRREVWIPLLNRLHKRGSTSIVGQRRIGKTWLLSYLKQVASTQLGPNYHIGYVDATTCDTLQEFTFKMLEALDIAPSTSSTTNNHLTLLEQTVHKMLEKKETIVLCIDEFEGLCDKADFHLGVLEKLRAMTNIGLCMVIASRQPLMKVIVQKVGKSGETSPFFNVFEQTILKPFMRKEAEAFSQAKGGEAGFTESECASLLKFGQEEEGKEQWPPVRLQLVGKMIEEDKILSEQDPLYPYLPSDLHYWQTFQARVEEKYQGIIS
jgi:transcriptional regulator with XRE-family HTH domain